ncbi:MAG: insulinase family protein [Sandaracinus sp.]|nr:insulinase family protein [Sandaracinus sp.]MCB9620909.1 insulinase family protein [Sandaracinus sp.]MCB9633769.1 insulinase family protein [Sandaracinus sp.]
MMVRRILLLAALSGVASFLACTTATTPPVETPEPEPTPVEPEPEPVAEREPPPDSGPARDVAFPPIVRTTLANGLELNTVTNDQLPVVHLRLVVRSGGETDPANLPGLSSAVADMLREGTQRRNSAQLAEAIEFLGADLWAGADEENVHLVFRALSDQLDEAMELLAEVATRPAFAQAELDKLKRRELDRIALQTKQPNYLGRRALFARLYGNHPYARIDTTPEALRALKRSDLQRWHRTHFVPPNAFLVAVGNVTPERVQAAAERAFGRWRGRAPSTTELPELPTRQSREVVLVDRPGAVQSVIFLGNAAIARRDPEWVPLMVANQVLGGSAASRLFMDLRERRSLTYGAYSQVGERVGVSPFVAWAAVRTEVTSEAMTAFFENLGAIVTVPPSDVEITNAQRYLSDSFPLQIDTPAKVAGLVADLRIFGLPDDYWEGYRTSIRAVHAPEALEAAQHHVRPGEMLVVVVGDAAQIAEPLRVWGPVIVTDENGNEKQRLDAVSGSASPTAGEQNTEGDAS